MWRADGQDHRSRSSTRWRRSRCRASCCETGRALCTARDGRLGLRLTASHDLCMQIMILIGWVSRSRWCVLRFSAARADQMPGQITLTEARRRSLHTEAFYSCMVSILHEHERAMQDWPADHKQVDAAGGWLPAFGDSSPRGAADRRAAKPPEEGRRSARRMT